MWARYAFQGFLKNATTTAAIVGGVASFLITAFGEEFRSRWLYWILVLAVHWWLILLLLWTVWNSSKNKNYLPKVHSLHDDRLLIVSKVEWLGLHVLVSIFQANGGYEKYLCQGRVINIQENGLVQIALLQPDHSGDTPQEQVSTKSIDTLLVKPGQVWG